QADHRGWTPLQDWIPERLRRSGARRRWRVHRGGGYRTRRHSVGGAGSLRRAATQHRRMGGGQPARHHVRPGGGGGRRAGGRAVTGLKRTTEKNLMVFSGRTHPTLATEVVELLGTSLTPTTAYEFANGEIYIRYD